MKLPQLIPIIALFSFFLFLTFLIPAKVAYADTLDFLDTFTAPNGTALGSYNGGFWRQQYTGTASIQNNSVTFSAGTNPVYTTNYMWSEDADISVTMNPSLFSGSVSSQGFGITDGSATCGLEVLVSHYVNNGSNHSFDITWGDCKQSGASVTVNKTYSNSNLIHTFKITKRGNTYNLYIDNNSAAQAITSTYYGKYLGIIRGYYSSGLDNFSIDQQSARQTEDCLVTTSPANQTLSVGGTAQISAQGCSMLPK